MVEMRHVPGQNQYNDPNPLTRVLACIIMIIARVRLPEK